jgi:hypothetical protein
MVVAAASILLPLKVKGKAQAVEAHRVERRWGSHNFFRQLAHRWQ